MSALGSRSGGQRLSRRTYLSVCTSLLDILSADPRHGITYTSWTWSGNTMHLVQENSAIAISRGVYIHSLSRK